MSADPTISEPTPPHRRAIVLAGLATVASALLSLTSGRTMAQSPAGRRIRLVAFGDSLTAGYGLRPSESFAAQLGRALADRGRNVEVVNAGVSGDTTGAGLARLDWAIGPGTDAVIVELGANDALRGADPARARANLDEIVRRIKAKGADVLLAGMRAPRNLGESYVAAFDGIFPDLAKAHGVLLYPFFLEGVATRRELNLDDGIHPTAEGIAVIVRNILPTVEALLDRVEARRRSGG